MMKATLQIVGAALVVCCLQAQPVVGPCTVGEMITNGAGGVFVCTQANTWTAMVSPELQKPSVPQPQVAHTHDWGYRFIFLAIGVVVGFVAAVFLRILLDAVKDRP